MSDQDNQQGSHAAPRTEIVDVRWTTDQRGLCFTLIHDHVEYTCMIAKEVVDRIADGHKSPDVGTLRAFYHHTAEIAALALRKVATGERVVVLTVDDLTL